MIMSGGADRPPTGENRPAQRVGILTTDTDLVVKSWDSTLEQMTGIAAERACGRRLQDLVPDLDSRGLAALLREPLVSGAAQVLAPALHRFLIPCPPLEPSVEFDVSCPFCGGTGSSNGGTCSKCKGAAWIELFGAGMVDPAVYGFVNYDAKKVSGFAFGIGIDRLAMLKYGIDDIQVFFQNDVRFLKQFP